MPKEISKYQNLDQIGGSFMNARNKLKKQKIKLMIFLKKS